MERNRMRKLLLAGLCALTALTPLAACEAKAADALKVGVRETVAGFGYKNELSGTYAGLEIDLARKLAAELGYDDVEFVSVTAQTREEALESGEVDCVIATFSVTEARAEKFNFSEAYYNDSLRVLTEDSTLFSQPEDLKDATVAVASGSTAALALAQELADRGVIDSFDEDSFEASSFDGGLTFQEYDNYPDMDTALEAGEVDVMCADGSILNGYLTGDRSLLDFKFSHQDYAVATPKDSALTEKINAAIAQWNADGTMEELRIKWDLE